MNIESEYREIWSGTLEWHEKRAGVEGVTPRQIETSVTTRVVGGTPEVLSTGWPTKLIMQLIPKDIPRTIEYDFLLVNENARRVDFNIQRGETLNRLIGIMNMEFCGCVHFVGGDPARSVRVLILYYDRNQGFYGKIPNDQNGFIERMRQVLRQKMAEKQNNTAHQNNLSPQICREITLPPAHLRAHEFGIMDVMS